jgi:hypothetical protein
MPRGNRPRRSRGLASGGATGAGRGAGPPASRWSFTADVEYAGQVWSSRPVRGNASGRSYRCPGCQHEVSAAVPHTVAWPAEAMSGVDNRRHWHTPCWQARERRRPGGSWA